MKGMINETKLARLEALADNYFKCVSLPFEESAYRELAIHFCPALVAEVRRLREKVEAWEWFGECFDNCKQRGKLPLEVHKTPSAYSEAWASLWAAREAVHADRE